MGQKLASIKIKDDVLRSIKDLKKQMANPNGIDFVQKRIQNFIDMDNTNSNWVEEYMMNTD